MSDCPWVHPADSPEMAGLLAGLTKYHTPHPRVSRCFTDQNVDRCPDELHVEIAITDGYSYDYLNSHFGFCHIVWSDGKSDDKLLAIVKLRELTCCPH